MMLTCLIFVLHGNAISLDIIRLSKILSWPSTRQETGTSSISLQEHVSKKYYRNWLLLDRFQRFSVGLENQ